MTNEEWVHRTVLERYKAAGMKSDSTGRWSDLREDGYIHEHLCWHLEKAGEFDQIVALLQEETIDGRNAWYEIREGLAQTGGYVTDLLRAWEMTRERSRGYVERGEKIATLALEIRLLLMVTSVNSLSATIPKELMGNLVRYGVWKPEVALDHCRRIPEIEQRNEALQAVLFALVDTERIDLAYRVLQEIHPWYRPESAPEIAPYLTAEGLDGALGLLRESVEEGAEISVAVTGLVPYLTDRQLQEALHLVRGMEEDRIGLDRGRALASIARYLASEEQRTVLFTEAFTIAEECHDLNLRAHLLADIIPSPDVPELRARGFSDLYACLRRIAKKTQDRPTVATILASLAPTLADDEAKEALRFLEALSIERRLYDHHFCIEAETRLRVESRSAQEIWRPFQAQEAVAPDSVEQALEAARAMTPVHLRAEALTQIAARIESPEIRAQVLSQALASVGEIDPTFAGSHLIAIARQMQNLTPAGFYPLWKGLLRMASLQSRQKFLTIFVELIPPLSNYGNEQTMEATLEALQDTMRWWPSVAF